jgi:Tfp pilus assembly protein PilX
MKSIHRRRGTAVVVALITLLVVTLIAATLVQSLLATHRQTRTNENELQAGWIAEAAVARAAAQLAARGDYTGETWRVVLDESNGRPDVSHAEIRVEKSAESLGRARVIASVQYPYHSSHAITLSRQQLIDLPSNDCQRGALPAESTP